MNRLREGWPRNQGSILAGDNFLCTKTSREILGFTQPQIQYVPMRIKQMEREAVHLPIPSIDVKNEWNYAFNSPPRHKYIFVVCTVSAFPLFTFSSRPSYRQKLSLFSLCHSTDNGTGPISYVFGKKKKWHCLLDRNLSATPGSSVRCSSVRTGCGRNEAARDTDWISIRDQQCVRSSVLNFILILRTINPTPLTDNEKVHHSLPNTVNCIFFRISPQLFSFKDYV